MGEVDYSLNRIAGMFSASAYSIPTIALARICYFVLVILPYKWFEVVQAVLPTPSCNRSPERRSHYILDLMPKEQAEEYQTTERRSRASGCIIRGGYCVPTMALANVCQKLTEISLKCLYSINAPLLTVLGMIQLQTRSPDGTREVENVQNHYIFDLRPEYGSDITKILHDVLKNNWLDLELSFRRKRRNRPKGKKYILKSGWRPVLVEDQKKKRNKHSLSARNNYNHQLPQQRELASSELSSISINSLKNTTFDSISTTRNTSQLLQLQEEFVIHDVFDGKLPIEDTDKHVDIVPMVRAGQVNYIRHV